MPAFIWVRVSVVWTTSETPDYLRSMTCHTVGSQLLVIGGLAPGREREERIPCNKRLVNVLDLNNPNGWASSYSANPPAYKQPEVVRKAAAGIAEPRAQSGWAHPRLKQLFDEAAAATSPTDSSIPNPTRTAAATSSSSPPAAGWSKGQIAGVIVGVVIGTAIIVGGAVILFMRRRRFQQALASTEPSEGSQEGRPELRAELSTHPPVIGSPVSAQHQTPEPETPQNPPPQEISSAPINNRGPPPPIPPNRPDSTVNT
ncbi:hypothetical protein K440DRAFT_632664 [Wilcoxina mikolae CBS 423.85]|nr:hypothetical protein K440DRAFT_632664 [Wilcoxina mikolae CBS 423.85]